MLKLAQAFLFLAMFVVMVASFQIIPLQQRAFGRDQGVVVLVGETLAFMCLAYIREIRATRPWLTVPLIWASIAFVLLTLAYVQLPSSRVARFQGRVAEEQALLIDYQGNHGRNASCPPLEAELRARTLEAEAARLRQTNIHAFSSAFEAKVAAAGAISAAALALFPLAWRRNRRPN